MTNKTPRITVQTPDQKQPSTPYNDVDNIGCPAIETFLFDDSPKASFSNSGQKSESSKSGSKRIVRTPAISPPSRRRVKPAKKTPLGKRILK